MALALSSSDQGWGKVRSVCWERSKARKDFKHVPLMKRNVWECQKGTPKTPQLHETTLRI
jgi:hypothetical protein